MYPSKDIVDNVMNSADHTTLIAAVKAAGQGDTLKGAGPSPLYELCSNERELQECRGRMVVAVAFTSEHPFLPDAIAELKAHPKRQNCNDSPVTDVLHDDKAAVVRFAVDEAKAPVGRNLPK